MKLKVIVLLLSVVTLSCGGSKTSNVKFTKSPPFSISKIHSQKWVAGVQGGGSGTNLFVIIEDVSEGVEIKEFYFRNDITEAKLTSDLPAILVGNNYVGYFKNETNRNVIMDSDISKEAANTPPQKSPFQLEENEAVISYTESGKIHYFKITNIEEKEILAYPQSNSNFEN